MSNSVRSIYTANRLGRLLLIAAVSALYLLAPGLSVADSDSPATSFSKLPPVADIELSPDGTKAVILRAMGDTYGVILMDFEKSKVQLLMAPDPDNFSFQWCRFANERRVVCSILRYIELQAGQVGIGRRFYNESRTVATRLLAVDIDGKNSMQLIKPKVTQPGRDLVWNPRIQDNVISWLDNDPDHILVQLAVEDRLFPSVYKLNIRTNRQQKVKSYAAGIFQWYADQNGTLRNGAGYRLSSETFKAVSVRNRNTTPLDISQLQSNVAPTFHGYLKNGETLLASSDLGGDRQKLVEIHATTGELLSTVFDHERYDIEGPALVRNGELVAVRTTFDRRGYHWMDKALGDEYNALLKQLPGAPSFLELISTDKNWDRLVLKASGNKTVPQYYLYSRGKYKKSLTALFSDYPKVDRTTIAEPTPIQYKSRDGMDIPGYLTLPVGIESKNLPTLIMPHGGPYSRDTDRFDYWVQYAVARGYAVLQPNFRGSTGYGNAFRNAGYNQWGRAMQTDLDDGLDWLVAQGITDPKRACIMGGSYGGYAALVAAFQSADRYQCAVAFAPVTDINELIRDQRNFVLSKSSINRLKDRDNQAEVSPVEQAEHFAIPLLIVHGDVDRTVRIEQSRTLTEALEAVGADYRYIEQQNGDHFLSLESHRREFLLAVDDFLQRHIGIAAQSADGL